MHTNRLPLARKILTWLLFGFGLTLLSGCSLALTNLTPVELPENPSNIYTLQVRALPEASTIVEESVQPYIVIDGEQYAMAPSPLGEGIYEIDYQLPPGRTEMRYYFIVKYTVSNNGSFKDREAYTELNSSRVLRRNVVSLSANRGPVGSRIGVLGRGFSPQDVIYVEGTPARTVYESVNALSFYIPSLPTGRNYRVALGGAGGTTTIGTLRVDASAVQIVPGRLSLVTGQSQPLTFTLPSPAPAGGLLLDITTDVPDSVIMPEVIVPAGQLSVTVNVTGGRTGVGSLFLTGFGGGEIIIPVAVTAR